MAELYLYFPPGLTVARDELEDAIENLLGARGEVTGGGSGAAGSNVDIAIADDEDVEAIVHGLSELLRTLGAHTAENPRFAHDHRRSLT